MTTATPSRTKRHATKLAVVTAACSLASVFAVPANASQIKFEFVTDSYDLIVEEPSFESWFYPGRKVSLSFTMDTDNLGDVNTYTGDGSIRAFDFGASVVDAQLYIEGVGTFKDKTASANFQGLDVSGSGLYENDLNVNINDVSFSIFQWIHGGTVVPDSQFDSLAQGIIDYYSNTDWGLWAFGTSEGVYYGGFGRENFSITQVPEPLSATLMILGLAGISARKLKRKSSLT